MRVLEKGWMPAGWEKRLVCTGKGNGDGGCHAKLAVGADDLYMTYSHHYDGSSESYVTFMCPECEVETDLTEEQQRSIPSGKRWQLPSKAMWLKSRDLRKPDTLVTVDIVVTINGRDVVLIERGKDPHKDKLVLPGGHVEQGERLVEACVRELEEEIGLVVRPEELELLTALDALDRDPRPGRRLSVVYRINLADPSRIASLKAGSDARVLHVRAIASLVEDEIGFDHWQAIACVR